MSEPRRILDGPSATPFERNLLESWSSEQPSPAARARARALAIAGAAATTLAAATAVTAVASTTGTAAGTAAPSAAGVGLAVIAKWGILLALAVGSAVGGVLVLGGARTADAPPPVTSSSPLANAAAGAQPSAASPAIGSSTSPPYADEPKAVSPADLPPASPTITATAITGAGGATAAAGATATSATSTATAAATGAGATASFAEEIASFDRARAALDAGDFDRALALVDGYEKRFPGGTFVQEAEVLRIQALARKGDSAGARRVGQRFLAAHPTSPHAARIRAILDTSAR